MPAIAPPKPSSVPNSPPKPAGSPTPTPGSAPVIEKPPSEYLSDISADLADLDAAGGPSPGPVTPKRGADGKYLKSQEKEPEKGPETPPETPEPEKAPETPPAPEKPVDTPKPGTMRALGKAYDELKKERNEVLQPKIQSLESKVKDYETQLADLRSKQPDLKPIQEKMTALEKENQQLREVVRFADYQKSPEFIEKHSKPYQEQWAKARYEITQLNVTLPDGSVRKATEADILSLANESLDQLDERAETMFPKSYPRVVRHIEKIKELADAQEKALEEAKKGAADFQSKQTLEQQTQQKEIQSAYAQTDAELVKKYPKFFAPDETDPAGNELLKKGHEYAAGVFENIPVKINGDIRPLTQVEKVKRLAVIKAKAANHDRLAARLKARDAEVADLESKLAQYEESAPPTTEAGEPTPGSTGGVDDYAAELAAMDRKGR